jgi:Xaa-Pro aminopeptidase
MSKRNEEKLLAYLEKEKLDAFFVSKEVNVRFISDYSGDSSFLLLSRSGKKFFITDPRFSEQASIECPDYEVTIWRKPGMAGLTVGDAIGELARREGLKQVAFESDSVSYETFQGLQQHAGVELVPVSGVIDNLRTIKTPQEIAWHRAACEISCRALDRLLPEIRVGVTEKELAAKLSLYMVQEGSDTMPYGNILISGARTSLLHGIPSSKAIEYGDFVLMDFGCQVNGYLSDMTRTVVVGKATAKQREVYGLEKKMVEDCLAITKAGVPCRDIYLESLKAIRNTEYFGYQYTNIGHGIGLFVHEMPMLTETSPDVLQAGNVRTIEPGIYIPGWGGVRIEDQLLVTEDGCENMVRFTHDLIEL